MSTKEFGKDRARIVLLILASALLCLNAATFAAAFNETFIVDFGCCTNHLVAKDFSAFYSSAWMLLHDPSKIYSVNNASALGIYPHPQPFKYLPSILFVMSPLLVLDYHDALIAFDLVQFALLIPIGYLIYELLKGKENPYAIALILIIALLEPSPLPGWGFSAPYYWQWAEGQTKVLLLSLLLLSFYLGKRGRPIISGVVFGLAWFDPRFALISLPLFLLYNKMKLRVALCSMLAAMIVFDSPLLIPGVGSEFASMVLRIGLTTPIYPYAYIPLIAILALIALNWEELYHFLFSTRSMVKEVKNY